MLDQDACRAFWIRRLHPHGPTCPDCKVSLDGRQAETFNSGGRVHCNSCDRWFSYRTGTIIHGLKGDDRQVYLLVMLTEAGCSSRFISIAARFSIDTVRSWQRRFREVASL